MPTYWLADPDEPSLTVLKLDRAGCDAQTARVGGDDVLAVERPYPLTLRLR